MVKDTSARYDFIGRNSDLLALTGAWEAMQGGNPHFILLRGDSGIGKTRLIQEFFSWLSSRHDNQHYWPDHLADSGKAMTLVPALPERPVSSTPDLPWLWMAVRCQERTHESDSIVAFDAVRRQLALHLAGLFQAQRRRAVHLNLVKAGFGLISSFALPGSGALVQAINTALDGGSGTLGAYEFYDAIKSKIHSNKSEAGTLRRAASQEQESMAGAALKAFRTLFSTDPKPPIILIIDDAHWLDGATSNVLTALLSAAGAQRWPLMIVAASWDEPLRFHEATAHSPYLVSLANHDYASDDVTFIEHQLSPLSLDELAQLVVQRLPHLDARAVTLIVERSAGDIDILDDFVQELTHSPGWLSASGDLAVPTSALGRLPSKAADMARRRLNAAGDHIREALTWASAQGIQFDELVLRDLLARLNRVCALHESLIQSDRRFGFTETSDHKHLELTGEFRRAVYFHACREFFLQHPDGNGFLRQLAAALRAIVEGDIWDELGHDEQQRIGGRLVALTRELGLRGRRWNDVVHGVLTQLAQARLLMGDSHGAEHYAEQLVRSRTVSVDLKEAARKTLVASAYMDGDIDRERRHLDEWRRSRRMTMEYFISESLFAMRQGDSDRSVSMAQRAQTVARNERERLDANLGLATALWSAGRPIEARRAIVDAEHAVGTVDTTDPLRLSLHHSIALVLHDLEQNAQVIYHTTECVARYQTAGNKQQELISRVNLGDALWGVGRLDDAAAQLGAAHAEAVAAHLLHAQDIAAICLGNVLREAGHEAEALLNLREGIALAAKIGHQWDRTYGEVYLEAATLTHDPSGSLRRLNGLRDQALRENYLYMAALATSLGYVARSELTAKASEDLSEPVPEAIAAFPIVHCFQSAARILRSSELTPTLVADFLRVLGQCEGIKGHRGFVLRALARVETEGGLSDVLRAFVQRWRGRFNWETTSTSEPSTFARCDYRTCEARCCYDGVYLVNNEEEKIRSAVVNNREFFAHVPDEFLTYGNWHGVSGIKTAVRPHEYESPDFPVHFNRTRCVFAHDDGGCSLQDFSTRHGSSPNEFKPISCVMHPLTPTATGMTPPPAYGEADHSYIGLAYPGFASFTPCGQPRSDGGQWQAVFAEEIEIWHARQNQDLGD